MDPFIKTVFVHTYSSVSETESLERKALLQWQSRLFYLVWCDENLFNSKLFLCFKSFKMMPDTWDM